MSNEDPEQRHRTKCRGRARLQAGFIVSGAWQSCLSCDHWSEAQLNENCERMKNPTCLLYKVQPPLDVIVVGCEAWDQIPF
jgi:hypothetical protein